jgi:membrane-associated phospholipid phosphatase
MRERAHPAAAATAACALLLAAVLYAVMVGTGDGRRMELLARFSGAWRHDAVRHAGDVMLHAVVPVAVATAVLVAVWTARNPRRREGWAALALLAIANVAAQAVKLVLPWLDPSGGEALRVTSGAFPSGHAALAGSAALAALIVAPARARVVVAAVGAAFVAAVDVSLLALGWHFPSDIVAGGLIALAAAVVVCPAWARPSARAALGGLLVVAAVALLVFAALAGARLERDGALAAGAIAAAAVPLGTILAASASPRRRKCATAAPDDAHITARYPTATPSP